MKKIFAVLVIVTISMVQFVYADDKSHRTLAEELLTIMDYQKYIEKSAESIKKMLARGGDTETQPGMKQLMDMITQEFSWVKMKDDLIGIYAESFTEEELKGIIQFYKTPIGQKHAQQTFELQEKVMAVNQKRMAKLMPLIQSVAQKKTETKTQLIGKPAPEFSLKDIDGKEVKLVDFKGKVLIVDFWATWCGPCRVEIPTFIALQSRYASKGFTMIGISTDKTAEVVRSFSKENKINYPLIMADEKVIRDYGSISAIPTTFLIDKKGVIRYSYEGVPSNKLIFQQNVEELMAE